MRIKQIELNGFKSFMERTVLELPLGRDGHRRAERLRQVERRRRHPLGAGRAEPEAPARRRHGGRHLRGQRRAAGRSAWPRCRCCSSASEEDLARAAEAVRRRTGRPGEPAARARAAPARSWSRGATSAPASRSTSSTGSPCRLKDITELFLGTGRRHARVRDHRAGARRADRERQAGGHAALPRGGRGHHALPSAARSPPSARWSARATTCCACRTCCASSSGRWASLRAAGEAGRGVPPHQGRAARARPARDGGAPPGLDRPRLGDAATELGAAARRGGAAPREI